uniref:Putative secreted protein n=1 Tax=Anopheles darlingi TaxID=43151 RepID=A0A2M4D4V5_ANODA
MRRIGLWVSAGAATFALRYVLIVPIAVLNRYLLRDAASSANTASRLAPAHRTLAHLPIDSTEQMMMMMMRMRMWMLLLLTVKLLMQTDTRWLGTIIPRSHG